MPENPMYEHIRAAATSERRGLTTRMVAACWPGGQGDRSEPAARAWLRLWHPARIEAPLPVCVCAEGRCGLCN